MPTQSDQSISLLANIKTYTYKPLKDAQDIRLLVLLPWTSEIRCKLIHGSLNDHEDYEALSYVWGDTGTKIGILLDDARLFIGSNLYEALQRFSPTSFPRYLWVDAICINQQDQLERSIQIQKMRQIYQHASRVLVWLGKEQKNSDLAMEFIANTNFTKMNVNELQGANFQTMWAAQGWLVTRQWWSRVWCLQEICVPERDPVLVCGTKEVAFRRFTEFFDCINGLEFETDRPAVMASLLILQNTSCFIIVRRCFQADDLGMDISLLLRFATNLGATDPKDKIYALLGLATRATRSNIIPDYSKPVSQVFAEATHFLLNSKNSLNPLSQWKNRSDVPFEHSLPSWVPNWSRKPIEAVDLPKNIYKATKGVQAELHPSPWNILRLDAILLDQVDHVSELFQFNTIEDTRSSLDQLVRMLESVRPKYKKSCALSIDPRKSDSIWRTLITDCITAEDLSQVHPAPAELSRLFEILLYGPGDDPRPWRSTASSDGYLDIPTLRLNSPRPSIPKSFGLYKNPTDRLENYLKPYLRRLWYFDKSRLFVTSSGRVGMAHSNVKAGDRIALLTGADTPFVLRPKEAKESFLLVGNAYVHGIMQGEALLYSEVEGRESYYSRVINLV
jgi:hypothetical protein